MRASRPWPMATTSVEGMGAQSTQSPLRFCACSPVCGGTWRRYDVSIESLWGPTPWLWFEVGREDVSGYLTIFSLCCWSASKKRSKAVGGRWRDSAIRDVNSMEMRDMRAM